MLVHHRDNFTIVIKAVLINPADKDADPGTVWGESVRILVCAHMGVMLENVDKPEFDAINVYPHRSVYAFIVPG